MISYAQFHRAADEALKLVLIRLPAKKNLSDVPSVTGILLIFAQQKIVEKYFLLKQLYDIGPWYAPAGSLQFVCCMFY